MKFSRTFAAEGLLERQGRERSATWGIPPCREPAQLHGKSRAKAVWWPRLLQDEGRHLPGGMGIKVSNASQQEVHREWQDAGDSTLMGNFPSACLEIHSRVLRCFYSMAQEMAAASDTIEAPLVLSLAPWFLSSQVLSVALRFLSTPSFPEVQDKGSAAQPHVMKRWQICNAIMLIWCHTLCALFFFKLRCGLKCDLSALVIPRSVRLLDKCEMASALVGDSQFLYYTVCEIVVCALLSMHDIHWGFSKFIFSFSK